MRFATLTTLIALSVACDPPGNSPPDFNFTGLPAPGCDDNGVSCADGAEWYQNATGITEAKVYGWGPPETSSPGAGAVGICDPETEGFEQGDELLWPSLTFKVAGGDTDEDDVQLRLSIRPMRSATVGAEGGESQLLCQSTIYARGANRTVPYGDLLDDDCSLYALPSANNSARADIERILGVPLRVNGNARDTAGLSDELIAEANAIEVPALTYQNDGVMVFDKLPMPCAPGTEDDFCARAHDALSDANASPERIYEVNISVSDRYYSFADDAESQADSSFDARNVGFKVYTFDPEYLYVPAFVEAGGPGTGAAQESGVPVAIEKPPVQPSSGSPRLDYYGCRTPESGSVDAVGGSAKQSDGIAALFDAEDTRAGDALLLRYATCWAPGVRDANGNPNDSKVFCTPLGQLTGTVGGFAAEPVLDVPAGDLWTGNVYAAAGPTVAPDVPLPTAVLWTQWMVGALPLSPVETDELSTLDPIELVPPAEAGPSDALALLYGFCPEDEVVGRLDEQRGWLAKSTDSSADPVLQDRCTTIRRVDFANRVPIELVNGNTSDAFALSSELAPGDGTGSDMPVIDIAAIGSDSWLLQGPVNTGGGNKPTVLWVNGGGFRHDLFFNDTQGIATVAGTDPSDRTAVVAHGDTAYFLGPNFDHSQPLDTDSCDTDPNCDWVGHKARGPIASMVVDGTPAIFSLIDEPSGTGEEPLMFTKLGHTDSTAVPGIQMSALRAFWPTDDGKLIAATVRGGELVIWTMKGDGSGGVIAPTNFPRGSGAGSPTAGVMSLDLRYDANGDPAELLIGIAPEGKAGAAWVAELDNDYKVTKVNGPVSGANNEEFGTAVRFDGETLHIYAPGADLSDHAFGSPSAGAGTTGVFYLFTPGGASTPTSSIEADQFMLAEDVALVPAAGPIDGRGVSYLVEPGGGDLLYTFE